MNYSRKLISDEFTKRRVSRQRKYQLRRRRDGKCIICGEKAPSFYCATHQHQTNARKRVRYAEEQVKL